MLVLDVVPKNTNGWFGENAKLRRICWARKDIFEKKPDE
jgi:hypothetical protein